MMNMIWLSLVFILWGILHSVLASLKIKALAKKFFGQAAYRYYRLVYNIFAGASLLPILGLLVLLPDKTIYTIPSLWREFLWLIQSLTLVMLVIGLYQTGTTDFLGLNILVGKNMSEPQNLKTDGLYKFVRHPIYSAGLLILWCSPVMTLNRLVVSFCISLYILIGACFEERKLMIEFGSAYDEYRKKVPMLIPGLRWNK
jgi:protein-S-isoprenylcysteine O-methyltransferase Ste14